VLEQRRLSPDLAEAVGHLHRTDVVNFEIFFAKIGVFCSKYC
jgi:hypothetical protein